MAERALDPWELGGDWWRDFDWRTLDKTVYPQGGGRRPRYADPGVMNAILKHVEDGLPLGDAARLGGASSTALYEWREAVPAVREALKGAEGALKAKMVAHITRAAPTQWAAAMTLLERRFPEDFGRRDRVQHEHAGQVGLTLAPGAMSSKSILMAAELEEQMALEERKALPEHNFESGEET